MFHNKYLLEIKDLSVEYRVYEGTVKAVNNLNIKVEKKKVIGIVGESGAGKTTTALSILNLIANPPGIITSGEIFFQGKDILKMKKEEIHKLRGNRISMIFQNPMTALNPLYTVGEQITRVIKEHQKIKGHKAEEKTKQMMEIVEIPRERFKNYPHEFSGGMKQRICIAIGLACNPSLLIADEPTTALDVTIQAQILELMRGLRDKFDTSIIFITHDLGVIAEMADYVVVMYAGSIVEEGSIKELFNNARHPYTQGLFACLPHLEMRKNRLILMEGNLPDPMNLPEGCKFYKRCKYKTDICLTINPSSTKIAEDHFVHCLMYENVYQEEVRNG